MHYPHVGWFKFPSSLCFHVVCTIIIWKIKHLKKKTIKSCPVRISLNSFYFLFFLYIYIYILCSSEGKRVESHFMSFPVLRETICIFVQIFAQLILYRFKGLVLSLIRLFSEYSGLLTQVFGIFFCFVVHVKLKRGVAQINSSGLSTSHQFIKIDCQSQQSRLVKASHKYFITISSHSLAKRCLPCTMWRRMQKNENKQER